MRLLVQLRLLLARHPAIYWVAVGLVAMQTATAVDGRLDRLDAARRSWTDTRSVWVASRELAPGDAVVAEARTLPIVAVPEAALVDQPAGIVVQRVDAGSVLTAADIGADRMALLPDGWEGVAVSTGVPSLPVEPGDRVRITDGIGLVVDDAIVISVSDSTAVIAVPEAVAPAVATAAQDQAVALTLKRP